MIERARLSASARNVRYVKAFGAETGLPAGSVDIVTCLRVPSDGAIRGSRRSRADPAARRGVCCLRLRRAAGGPSPGRRRVCSALRDETLCADHDSVSRRRAETWPKDRHLARIGESGHFRFVRELVCHGMDGTDAKRVIGFAESVGGPAAVERQTSRSCRDGSFIFRPATSGTIAIMAHSIYWVSEALHHSTRGESSYGFAYAPQVIQGLRNVRDLQRMIGTR